jgi:acetyltransferase
VKTASDGFVNIELLTTETAAARRRELGGLLRDAVEHGASIGFVLPLTDAQVEQYWSGIGGELAAGRRLLLAALAPDGSLAGSAQLVLESRANGRHRAEVQKVMVLATHRGRGIGAALMARVETEARARGRHLLYFDTSLGAGGATAFYDRLGYARAGSIPGFATDPDGSLAPNVIYYKRLE